MPQKPTYDELEKRIRELEGTVNGLKQADIARRKNLEASLRLTQFCFDSASVGIYHIQSEGRFLSVNAHAAGMLGYTVEELSGLSIWDIDPSANKDQFIAGWKRLVANGVDFFETTHIRKDGSRIPVEISSNFLEYDGRQFSICFVQDITQRKRTEETLRINQFSFDNANIAIYRIAPDARIVEANKKAGQLLGYSKEELENMFINDVDPTVTRESWGPMWHALVDEGSFVHEREHRKKDGCIIPVEVYVNFLEYEDQQYAIAFIQDTSERKRAEEALKENERLLNNILDSANEGLFVLDRDYRYTIFNASLERISGKPKEEVIGKIIWDVFPHLKGTQVEKNLKTTMDGKSTGISEIQLSLPNRGTTWFRDSFSPLKDDKGNVLGIVCMVADITKQKQAENERENLLKELQEALENVKILSGLLPICSSCKKIRDDKGYWNQIESYIHKHSEAKFSHSICPDCAKKLYPELFPPRD